MTAPTLVGQQGTLTVEGALGPAQDRSQRSMLAQNPAPGGNQNSTEPDPVWGMGLIWSTDTDIGNLTQADPELQLGLLQTWA